MGLDAGARPPEINSGLVYAGPQSGPLAAAMAAWEALAADLTATATAFQAAVTGVAGASFTGPTSALMAGAGEQHVAWCAQTAGFAHTAAAMAGQCAAIVEAVHAGVVPPPEIEANRNLLQALIATNFMGINSGAIAATTANYERMWAQDSSALYSYAGDSAAAVAGLVPFMPMQPTVNPAGAADQAASVSQAVAQGAGNTADKASSAVNQLSNPAQSAAGGASDFMSMAPQFMSTVPQVLQGMASPLSSANPMQAMSGFQSLLGPLMGAFGGQGLGGATPALAAAEAPALSAALSGAGGGLGGVGGGTGALSAALGGAPKLGGLSVPATWAASSQNAGGANASMSVSGSGVTANSSAAPGGAPGGMGGAPMAALGNKGQSSNDGHSYGSPVRVLPRPR